MATATSSPSLLSQKANTLGPAPARASACCSAAPASRAAALLPSPTPTGMPFRPQPRMGSTESGFGCSWSSSAPSPSNSHPGPSASSASTSSQRSTAMASTSKPGPRLATEAGTLILIDPPAAGPSQLECLGQRPGVPLQLHRRRDVAERGLGVLEAIPRQHHHRGRVPLDPALPDQADQERERGAGGGFGEESLGGGQLNLGAQDLGVA